MPALSTHLREPETHARLAFHPGCPICRAERLSGSIANAAVLPQRVGAALAAGALAIATVGPAGAFASEPDSKVDGTTTTKPAVDDAAPNSDFDPGGDAPDSPDQSAPVYDAPDTDTDDDLPPDQATPADDTAAIDTHGDTTAPASAVHPPASAAPATTPTTVPQPAAAPATNTEQPLPPPPTAAVSAPAPAPSAQVKAHTRGDPRKTHAHRGSPTPGPAQMVARAPAPRPAPAQAPTQLADHAAPADRTHTVQAGESLWSIAGDIVGRHAGSAKVAREVHRLWELNKDAIATGDPDLLMVGTRLRLR